MWTVAWLSTNIAVPALWGFSVLFVGLYSFLQPWWRHSIGWTIAGLDAAIGLVLTPSILHMAFGLDVTSAFYQWFVLVVFMLAPGFIAYRIWILCSASRWRFRLPWRHPAARMLTSREYPDVPSSESGWRQRI